MAVHLGLTVVFLIGFVPTLIKPGTSLNHSVNCDTEVKVLRLLAMLPYPANDNTSLQPLRDIGPALLPAAELAVRHVNEDHFTLSGYKVELLNSDGGCNVISTVLNSYVRSVLHGPPIVGIIGPVCSSSTIAVSSLTGRTDIALPNVHLATSPFLANRTRYGHAFGIVGSSFSLVIATFFLMEYNSWDGVAVIYDSISFVHLNDQLRNILSQELQRNRVVFFSAVYDTYIPIDALEKSSARVIISFINSIACILKVLCIAYTRGIVFPHYQWVISGYSFDELSSMEKDVIFQYSGVLYTCDSKVIFQNTVLINYRLSTVDKQEKLVSGYTYDDVLQQYFQEIVVHNRRQNQMLVSQSISAAVTYDAVWALIVAINMTVGNSFNDSLSHDLNCVRFGNEDFADKVRHNFEDLMFSGMSGPIKFDSKTGFSRRDIEINYVNSSMLASLVGVFSNGNISILTSDPMQVFIQTTYRVETVKLPVALLCFFLILFLCLATLVIHIFTTVKRHHPSIKASSPLLNNLVFLGCYVWTVSAVVYIIVLRSLGQIGDGTFANGCHALWVWLMPIGCTLTYGTLMAKSWRIYRIFVHFRNPGHLISNKVLISFVLVQLSVDLILGTVWSIVSPASASTRLRSDNSVKFVTQRSCVFIGPSGMNDLFWIVILYSWKALQVLALIILCFLTRNIRNKNFNTFGLTMASYLSFILLIALLPPYTVLWYHDAEIHIDFVLLCTLITCIISVHLIFVLLPPILPVIKQYFIYKRMTS